MRQINLYEARTHLSALVQQAAKGEEIWIAKNGRALARLIPLADDEAETNGEGDSRQLKA